MSENLACIAFTQGTTPLAVRERLARLVDRNTGAPTTVCTEMTARCLVISTCERVEIYSSTPPRAPGCLLAELAGSVGVPADQLVRYARVLTGVQVTYHLLRVASGLESRIFGESAILGQVRGTYRSALERKALSADLAMLGRAAIRAGRRVRRETAVGAVPISVATLAADHVSYLAGSKPGRCLAIVGTGQVARSVAYELRNRGFEYLTFVGHDPLRTRRCAARFHADFAVTRLLSQRIPLLDAMVCCTHAPGYVVDVDALRQVAPPLAILDLGVPRNVDPAVGQLPGIFLTDLDEIVPRMKGERPELFAAERIIHEEAVRFERWCRERRAVGRIARLVNEARVAEAGGWEVDRGALHHRILGLKAEVVA